MSDPSNIDDADQARQSSSTGRTGKTGGFARYKDLDGRRRGFRTLPGTEHPAAATSRAAAGTTTNRLQRAPRRLRKQHGAPQPQVRNRALFLFLVLKLSKARTQESESSPTEIRMGRNRKPRSAAHRNMPRNRLPGLRACPFTREVLNSSRARSHYVVEQNRDAQMSACSNSTSTRTDQAPAQHQPSRRPAARARSVTDELSTMEGK